MKTQTKLNNFLLLLSTNWIPQQSKAKPSDLFHNYIYEILNNQQMIINVAKMFVNIIYNLKCGQGAN